MFCGLPNMYIYCSTGHTIVQVQLIFRLLHSDTHLAYVEQFNLTAPLSSNMTNAAAGMHILKCAMKSNGSRAVEVIPLRHIRSLAHVIPCFGKEANTWLTRHTSYELSNKFWLNKYWNKEFFYALTLS